MVFLPQKRDDEIAAIKDGTRLPALVCLKVASPVQKADVPTPIAMAGEFDTLPRHQASRQE